jgi:hypothetical protein
VVVRINSTGSVEAHEYSIIDQKQIQQLVSFANDRRDAFRPSLYTMPAPTTTAAFYDNDDLISVVGSGPNFFFVSCSNWRGIRSAKELELITFQSLIVHEKTLSWP